MPNPQLLMPFLTDGEHPPANRTRTSIAAAEQIAPVAKTMRAKVLEFIAGRGARGVTRQEIADWTGWRLQTVCGRCNELLKAGLIWQGKDVRDGGKILRARQ